MFAHTNTSGVTFGVIESKYKTFHETDETQWALCMSLYLRVPWIQVAQFLVCLYSQRSVYLTIWEEKGTTEDEMAGWHHRLDGREFEWTLGDGDGQGGLACCNSWGRKESDTTERLNWNWVESCILLIFFQCWSPTTQKRYWNNTQPNWILDISHCIVWPCAHNFQSYPIDEEHGTGNLKCCNSLEGNVPWIPFFSYEVAMLIMIIFKGNKLPLLPHKSKLSLVANGTFAQGN